MSVVENRNGFEKFTSRTSARRTVRRREYKERRKYSNDDSFAFWTPKRRLKGVGLSGWNGVWISLLELHVESAV